MKLLGATLAATMMFVALPAPAQAANPFEVVGGLLGWVPGPWRKRPPEPPPPPPEKLPPVYCVTPAGSCEIPGNPKAGRRCRCGENRGTVSEVP